MRELVPVSSSFPVPSLIAAASRTTRTRFLEFFVNTIRNENTRRAYSRAVGEFLVWCEA